MFVFSSRSQFVFVDFFFDLWLSSSWFFLSSIECVANETYSNNIWTIRHSLLQYADGSVEGRGGMEGERGDEKGRMRGS